MGFIKHAKADILDVRGSSSRQRISALDKFSDFDEYRTDDNYIYVRVRAITSSCNKNWDSWPSEELQKSYKTFLYKPNFVDHHNFDPQRARGVVVDAKIHVEDDKTASFSPYYSNNPDPLHLPPTWVELLLETDAQEFPKLARAITNGDIDSVSMGANVGFSKCAHCNNVAHSEADYCQHIRSKGSLFDWVDPKTGHKTSKNSYEHCYDIGFFELSYVFDPADENALFIDKPISKRASVRDEVVEEGRIYLPARVIAAIEADEKIAMQKGAPYPKNDDEVDHSAPGHHLPQKVNEIYNAIKREHPEYSKGQAIAIAWSRSGEHHEKTAASFNDPHDFVDYLKSTLIPDLKESGNDFTADDFEEAVMWIEQLMNGEGVQNISPVGPQPTGQMFPDTLPWGEAEQDYYRNASVDKTADTRKLPQSELTVAPEKVDTLRQESVCPVCGSGDMTDGACPVCSYSEPPEGFGNPDLTKAINTDHTQEQQGLEAEDAQAQSMLQNQAPTGSGMPGTTPMSMAARLESIFLHDDEMRKAAANLAGGRVNVREKALLPTPTSDKPKNEKIVSDSLAPVKSNITKENMPNNTRTADGPRPNGGADVQPATRVDVMGIGGVGLDPESGIKTVDPTGVGGVEKADWGEHVELDAPVADAVGPHTDTWNGNEGDSAGQHNPVGSESTAVLGSAVLDGDPATHVELDAPLAEEVGPPTMTFGGDDFHLTDPVTNDAFPPADECVTKPDESAPSHEPFPSAEEGVRAARVQARRQFMAALKIAEQEIALGTLPAEQKYDRISELEDEAPETLEAISKTLAKVKTAGLSRKVAAAPKTSTGGLPSLQNTPTFGRISSHNEDKMVDAAERIFG